MERHVLGNVLFFKGKHRKIQPHQSNAKEQVKLGTQMGTGDTLYTTHFHIDTEINIHFTAQTNKRIYLK